VHAMTDVTGFGLLGHGLEMCRGSGLSARIRFDALPLLEGVAELARVPYRTGAAGRNWDSYGREVALAPHLAPWQRDLMCDPQTSGGLLVAVAPEAAQEVLDQLRAAGFGRAVAIGETREGSPGIDVV
jgi:selenide,water dikinase